MRKASKYHLAGFSNPNDIGAIIRAKYIVHHGISVASDFVPETFGRLTTIGPKFLLPYGSKGKSRAYQVCQCSCGVLSIHATYSIRSGNTKSCGCLNEENIKQIAYNMTTHGMSKVSGYNLWRGMLDRCYNSNNKKYHCYGGRGIRVCGRWQEPNGQGFLNFLEDMGPRPGPEYTLDRHPNWNGNYEPSNCRWATKAEQNRNTRKNRYITAFGKTQLLVEWAEEYGIDGYTITLRLKRGWTLEDAISKPVRYRSDKGSKKK